MQNTRVRKETELEVRAYIQNLKYALEHGARLQIQMDRYVEKDRDIRFTNRYTLANLFPDKSPEDALRQELQKLTVADYIQTVRDLRFPNRSEMREFGKNYKEGGDVFIRVRVELLANNGNHTTFVMSFHYAMTPFTPEIFPYRRVEEESS